MLVLMAQGWLGEPSQRMRKNPGKPLTLRQGISQGNPACLLTTAPRQPCPRRRGRLLRRGVLRTGRARAAGGPDQLLHIGDYGVTASAHFTMSVGQGGVATAKRLLQEAGTPLFGGPICAGGVVPFP